MSDVGVVYRRQTFGSANLTEYIFQNINGCGAELGAQSIGSLAEMIPQKGYKHIENLEREIMEIRDGCVVIKAPLCSDEFRSLGEDISKKL